MKFYDQPDGASQTKVLTRARMETHPHEFEPAELLDAFGERALQVYLERCYSVYLTNTSSLIQQRVPATSFSS